jgi:hypothetical protein
MASALLEFGEFLFIPKLETGLFHETAELACRQTI